MNAAPPVWQLTTLFGPPPALLSHDDGGWRILLDKDVIAGRSLDEAVDAALRERAARERPRGARGDDSGR